MDASTFGYWLRRRRKSLDWTQAELARRVNCTGAMIRKIEADERKPSRQLAEQLADQLNVPADQRSAFLNAARHTVSPDDLSFDVLSPLSARRPNNLPTPLTSLIDRVHDIAAVSALLTRDDVRLLTLLGPPGIGKTRLCIQSAVMVLGQFSDGVWFVDLAPVSEPALVLPTIVRALNIAESGALSPVEQLAGPLRDKHTLLAVDNFEQVMGAAREVTDLLKACPGLKVMATSRVPLHVYGEHEYAVPAMSLPPRRCAPDKLIEYEAVQLFRARVREHQPNFAITPANAATIVEVCIRLDGVPLALELAAASLRRMTLEQLVTSLGGAADWLPALHTPARDLPPRQRTLYSAIAWSYSLLDEPTRTAFRSLGVCPGGFDAQAATAICALAAQRIEPALATLSDHSLLARAPGRWQMLEMIREFALEQMSADERASAQQRHALHFAARLQTIAPEDVSLLELDHDNFRAALIWAIRVRDGLLALTMCGKLADYWETRGYLRGGLALAREVLAISENVEPRLRIGFLGSVGHLAWNRYETETALALTEQGIALARTMGLEEESPYLFNILGRIFIEQGDYARAEQTFHDCIQLSQKTRDKFNVALATTQLGEVALACGKLAEAQSLSEQALVLLGSHKARFIAMAHTTLAEVAIARGAYTVAREELQRVAPHLEAHTRLSLSFLASVAGWFITKPRARQDDVRRGVELFGVVERLVERPGAPPSKMYHALNETRTEIARRRLTGREWQEAWHRGGAMTMEQAIEYAQEIIESD